MGEIPATSDQYQMAESREELKSLLMKVKEESEKSGLKLNIKKLSSWHPVSYFKANRREKVEAMTDFRLQNHCGW